MLPLDTALLATALLTSASRHDSATSIALGQDEPVVAVRRVSRTTADLAPIMRKRLEVIGTLMRIRTPEERKALVAEFAERMLPLFDRRIEQAAPLRPVVQERYPMSRIADAHRLMESNQAGGKLVVVVS